MNIIMHDIHYARMKPLIASTLEREYETVSLTSIEGSKTAMGLILFSFMGTDELLMPESRFNR